MRAGSVRLRTTVAVVLVAGLALALGGWLLLHTLSVSLAGRDDAGSRAWARDLAALASAGDVPVVIPPHGEDDFAQVVVAGGRVLASTRSAPVQPVARLAAAQGFAVRTIAVRDGPEVDHFRVWSLTAPSASGRVTVYAGTNLEEVSETVGTVRWLLLSAYPVLLLLLGIGTWVAVGRALRPVESVRAQVAAISERDLTRRVPVPPGRDEVADLARTMNAMLDRIEAASDRQRRFTADASHELRSPLARLRAQIEVALARPDGTDWPTLATELLAVTQQIEALGGDLLFLARDDEGASPQLGEIDLDDVVLEEVARLRPGSQVAFDTVRVSAAPVVGSRDLLRRLVRNLLENAVRHASTEVVVSLRASDGGAELVVTDDGPGVPVGDRDRVFDRFVQLDSARASGGSGLGLAIVAAVASRHGGSVTIDDAGPGAVFVVRLPGGDHGWENDTSSNISSPPDTSRSTTMPMPRP